MLVCDVNQANKQTRYTVDRLSMLHSTPFTSILKLRTMIRRSSLIIILQNLLRSREFDTSVFYNFGV